LGLSAGLAREICDSVWEGQACTWDDELCSATLTLPVVCPCTFNGTTNQCDTNCPATLAVEAPYANFCQLQIGTPDVTGSASCLQCSYLPGCRAVPVLLNISVGNVTTTIRPVSEWTCSALCPQHNMQCTITALGDQLRKASWAAVNLYQLSSMLMGPLCNCRSVSPCQPVSLGNTWTCAGSCSATTSTCKVSGTGLLFQEIGLSFQDVLAYQQGSSCGNQLFGSLCTCLDGVDVYNPLTGSHQCLSGCPGCTPGVIVPSQLVNDTNLIPSFPDKQLCACPTLFCPLQPVPIVVV